MIDSLDKKDVTYLTCDSLQIIQLFIMRNHSQIILQINIIRPGVATRDSVSTISAATH